MNKTIIILTVCSVVFTATICFSQNATNANANTTTKTTDNLSREDMVKAVAAKNIFKPSQATLLTTRVSPTISNLPSGPTPLLRPFTLIGINISNQGAIAQLLFSNPTARKAVTVGESIESVTITKIENTYLRCNYSGYDVKIDVGESSEDARRRILGFDRNFEFVGTTISNKEAFAYVNIGGELRRLEVGDSLGESEIISIQAGKLWIRHSNGQEFAIDPTNLNRSGE